MKTIKIILLIVFIKASVFAFDLNKFKSDAAALALENELNVHIPLSLISDQIVPQQDREVHKIIFTHPYSGTCRILISGPKGFWQSTQKYQFFL